jgi:hypothetical protein
LAANLVKDIPASDPIARARAMESHLLDPGQYTYSLTAPLRDPNLDRIVDFVTKSKMGHCEYFASALTLMLRSQEIPARIVVGFKGGDYNSYGNFYQVRQLHAHTWVEAYLPPEHIPPEVKVGGDWESGAWLRLDPTPGAEEVAAAGASVGRGFPSPREMFIYVQFLWTNYVAGLDSEVQKEVIYKPLVNSARDAWKWMTDGATWTAMLSDLKAILTGKRKVDLSRWFHWRAGLIGALSIPILYGIYRLVRRLIAWFRRMRGESLEHSAGRQMASVEFYRRLEHLLARHAWVRPRFQTQREFATSVGGLLADDPQTQQFVPVPRSIVDAFYRVRFGGRTLDKREAEGVEQALNHLETGLAENGHEA